MMNMPNQIVIVGGIVEDEKGHILLVKTQHSGWIFPGCQIVKGENLMSALIRDIKEESGIDVDISYLIGVYSNTGVHKWRNSTMDIPIKLMFDFMCKPMAEGLCTFEETSENLWLEKDKVLDMISDPGLRTRYQAYMGFGGSSFHTEFKPWGGELLRESGV